MRGFQSGFGSLRRVFTRPSPPQLRSLSTSATPPVKSSGMWNAYLNALEKRPILVKAVTSGFLAFSADVICQLYSPHKDQLRRLKEKHQQESAERSGGTKDFAAAAAAADADAEFSLHELQLRLSIVDTRRLSIFTFLGVAYIGPCLHFWYGFLMRAISGVSARATLTRVLLDQSLFAPTFLAGLFANGLLLEGRPEAIEAKIRSDLPQTVLMNWSVWIPSMLVMFRVCPAHLQVLFSNSIGFFWNIYLTWKLNEDGEDREAPLAPIAAEK